MKTKNNIFCTPCTSIVCSSSYCNFRSSSSGSGLCQRETTLTSVENQQTEHKLHPHHHLHFLDLGLHLNGFLLEGRAGETIAEDLMKGQSTHWSFWSFCCSPWLVLTSHWRQNWRGLDDDLRGRCYADLDTLRRDHRVLAPHCLLRRRFLTSALCCDGADGWKRRDFENVCQFHPPR